jgi:hypothetical protein
VLPRSAPAGDLRGLRQAVRVVLLCGILLLAVGWWRKDALPAPEHLRPELMSEPLQLPVEQPAFRTVVEGVEYSIQPRYSYDISGLVVSLHDSDTWWDTAHREWDDHINLMDLCVVWGRNASSGIYREVRFSNTQWTCHMSARSGTDWQAFNTAQASNNHMVTDRPEVGRALRRIHVGDQVRVRGYLVDYTTYRNGVPFARRVSSDSRTDDLCEVIYVTSIEPLAASGTASRFAFALGAVLLMLGAVAWLLLPLPRISEGGGGF